MHTDTPNEIDENVLNFCKFVSPRQKPFYVACKPDINAARDECFENVRIKVSDCGGEQIFGWQVWLWPDTLIEAEFHSVWQLPDKTFLDITPKDIETPRILFLKDPDRTYEGEDIDNIRLPLRDDRLVRDFISLAKAHFIQISEGRVSGTQEVQLNKAQFEALARARVVNLQMLDNRSSRNTKCPCGSGEKYKRCHEVEIEKIKKFYRIAS